MLIEGHTDAVGSFQLNHVLFEQRAASLKRTLVRKFSVPGYALETVGYGEEFPARADAERKLAESPGDVAQV